MYHHLKNNNPYLWLQFDKDTNSKIDAKFKNRFLKIGDSENNKITETLEINFSKSQMISRNESRSILRFKLKNLLHDKIDQVVVPEEIFSN